ncbi:MAG: hypothetical protein WDK95_14445 [Syntrophorhabdaceae bacterium]
MPMRELLHIIHALGVLWEKNPELREGISKALEKGGKHLVDFYNKIVEKLSR